MTTNNTYRDERGASIDFDNLEIVVDDDTPLKVEIYRLDDLGHRAEGGTFDRAAFMQHVLEFYHKHF